MSGITLGLDIVIIVMLGATIFYAVRLSKHLSVFRSNCGEMERLIRELSTQITRAQEGITVLDEMSSTQGENLRKLIAKAQGLCDELEIMTEAGDFMAGRLETLAERNREIAENMGQNALNAVYPSQREMAKPKKPEPKKPEKITSFEDALPRASRERVIPSMNSGDSGMDAGADTPFTIRDPDYETEGDSSTGEGDDAYLSKAERELMAALRNHKK